MRDEPQTIAGKLARAQNTRARGRLRVAEVVKANHSLTWERGGWRYELERAPWDKTSERDNQRHAAVYDLRVTEGERVIFRDRVQCWDGSPVMVPDGDGFREDPVEAARIDLAHTVKVVTKGGREPWVKAKPGTVSTFYGDTADEAIECSNADYATARAGSNLTVPTGAVFQEIRWAFLTPNYLLTQLMLAFDTSALPDTDDVSDAAFSLYVDTVPSAGTALYARAYDWGASVTTADWRSMDGTSAGDTLLAQKARASTSAGAYADFVSEAAFPGAVSKTGTTRMYVFVSDGESASAPGAFNQYEVRTANATGTTQDPKLVVTHAPALVEETVAGNQPASTGAVTSMLVSAPAGAQAAPSGVITQRSIRRFTGADNSTLTWETVAPEADDLFLLAFYNDGGDNQTTPGDLTRLDTNNGSTVEGGLYYRECTGAESGTLIASEASFGVSTEEYCWHAILIPAFLRDTAQIPVHVKAGGAGGTGTIDPGEVTAPWGSTDNIFVVFAGRDDDDGISSLGANYVGHFGYTESAASTGSCEVASSWRTATAAAEDPPTATQTNTDEEWIAYTVVVKPWVLDIPIAGAQAAPSGAIARQLDLNRTATGTQPAASGALTIQQDLSRTLSGAQAAPSGTVDTLYKIAIAGAQGAPSGALTFDLGVEEVSVAGEQAAPSGSIASVKTQFDTLTGSQPAPTGSLAAQQDLARTVEGAQAAPSGTVDVLYQIALAGNQGAPEGDITTLTAELIAGNQPSADGDLIIEWANKFIQGSQDAPSGTIAALSTLLRLIEGNQPAPSGTIDSVSALFVDLAGEQPASTGTLTIEWLNKLIAGDQGSPSGLLEILQRGAGIQPERGRASTTILERGRAETSVLPKGRASSRQLPRGR